jgi:hypothetical protein
MSTLSQFAGGAATTSIVNGASSGGVLQTSLTPLGGALGKEVLSGALTANTLATALTVTGGGEVPFLVVYAKDNTSRTMRIKVTVDGASVFDATSSACTTSGSGLAVVGIGTSTNYVTAAPAPLRFNASLLVEIASSLSETDKIAIGYILNKR